MRSLVSYDDAPEPAAAVAAPAPAVASSAAEGDAWCQRVAASERARVQQIGYDAATLDRMTLAAYQQCRTLAAR